MRAPGETREMVEKASGEFGRIDGADRVLTGEKASGEFGRIDGADRVLTGEQASGESGRVGRADRVLSSGAAPADGAPARAPGLRPPGNAPSRGEGSFYETDVAFRPGFGAGVHHDERVVPASARSGADAGRPDVQQSGATPTPTPRAGRAAAPATSASNPLLLLLSPPPFSLLTLPPRTLASAALLFLLAACDGGLETPADDKPADTDSSAATDTETGETDDTGGPGPCFLDADGDGYGDTTPVTCASNTADDTGDCDDGDETVHPGAPETCDTLDNDCDGNTDDADDDVVDGLPFYRDADGDGFGAEELVTGCVAGAGLVFVGGDCDDADVAINPGAAEVCDDVDQDCNGLSGDALGASAECPATSCLEVRDAGGSGDGQRWLILPSGATTPVWCDLSTDGGGWTLGFLRNTASTGSQGDFGEGDLSLEALAGSGESASLSATPLLGWMDLNAFSWTELRLGAWNQGALSYSSRSIPRSALLNRFGDPGYLLYGGETGYYWCGGPASYTDAGSGATNNPSGAPLDCKGHGSLGSGWDFSESPSVNVGLTLCGGDGSYFMSATWGGTYTYYGAPGAAQGIWVR